MTSIPLDYNLGQEVFFLPSIRPIIYAGTALFILVSGGIYGIIRLEGKNFMDALWLMIVSITTVGYGDVVPSTTAGRLMTMFIVVCGVGLLTYVLGTVFVGVLEGHLSDVWGKRKMMREIAKLNGHIVVCGSGRVGREVMAELLEEKQRFVVIEKDPVRLEELKSEGSVLFIAGDATEDKVLLSARVPQAKGVITTLPDDAENLLITIACKDFNPRVRVVARANRPESVIRLRRSGADTVVCPSSIAGSRMALASLKPASVALVQTLVEDRNIDLRLEELSLSESSPLAGKELKDSGIRENYGIMVLAIGRGKENIINPPPREMLQAGDLLILCGRAEGLASLEKVLTG